MQIVNLFVRLKIFLEEAIMNEIQDYQKEFYEILPTECKNEFEKLQMEYKQLENHCKNFSKNVKERCEEKLKNLKEKIINNSKNGIYGNIDENMFFCFTMIQGK